ncbi:B12-binding domain-containing radical SAM protein [Patescibacteria group bacterium]|nr:B12-binding domain-containing radical SAM protein [Candidatus Falkowbacteria bacterium]MBU3906151.1 B12-binding domain-containing radical SAM protein [Patescibacteria group bacterium]MBU4014678.1 B12-binding domain-containing radical SAM protein [Patescibacteria group bacterium]MBU4026644.1 B12-binding domain-containing radical SAM protein [Patescibacteria group bacterium]MBU4073543.1 B12-binding domain-containing radical SAM protein [Patescibacteria group bacterium]
MPVKILFIIPPYFNIEDFLNPKNNQTLPVFTIPYGILSMEAYIKANATKEVAVELLDLNTEAYKIAKNNLNATNIQKDLMSIVLEKLQSPTDIVGISALFNNSYEYLKELTYTIKKAPMPPLCIVGGGLASNLYQRVLNDFPLIDGVCFAEGEIPLIDLINSDNFPHLLNEHPSWITKETLKDGKIPRASYVENLDNIPMSDYSLVDLNNYNGRSLDKQYCNQNNKREISIHTSRGCPFNCVFCANSSVHGKMIRYMSEKRVISEVDNMINNFGMNVLLIEDDHFLSNKKRAARILAELNRRNIRIEFPNGIAVHAIDEEIGKLLKEAGVTTVQLAVESCSDYVLEKIINKPHRVFQIRKTTKILKENGIFVHAFIVLGLPNEMDEHRKESLEIIKEIGFDWVYFFIAAPIAGSRLYKVCVENNYLVEKDFKNHIVSKGSIKAPGVDPDEIEKIAYKMNLDVNFVNNSNVLLGLYDRALPYFIHISNKYPKHALAHYVLMNIYKQKKEDDLSKEHHDIYLSILKKSKGWKTYASEFNL